MTDSALKDSNSSSSGLSLDECEEAGEEVSDNMCIQLITLSEFDSTGNKFITAHVRSLQEDNVFSRVCLFTRDGLITLHHRISNYFVPPLKTAHYSTLSPSYHLKKHHGIYW